MKSPDVRTRSQAYQPAATRESTHVAMHGIDGRESGVRDLQRAINASPRMVAQRRIMEAASRGPVLQRVAIPGTNLDTSTPGDHVAIADHISDQRMTLDEMTHLVTILETLQNRTPLESMLLSVARYQRAKRRDINTVYERASQHGIWTTATVLIDGREVLVTPPEQAQFGRDPAEHAYAAQGQGVSREELESSGNDSEIATLQHLSDFFWAAQTLGTARNINVIFSGSMGPCDGCKGRIRSFANDVGGLARNIGAHFRLIIDVNYSTPNNEPASRRTLYGYPGSAIVTVLPNHPAWKYEYYTMRLTFDF